MLRGCTLGRNSGINSLDATLRPINRDLQPSDGGTDFRFLFADKFRLSEDQEKCLRLCSPAKTDNDPVGEKGAGGYESRDCQLETTIRLSWASADENG